MGMDKKISRSQFLAASAGVLFGAGTVEASGQGTSGGAVERRILGKTGIAVSVITLGAGDTTDPDIVRLGLDRGVNAIDTARRYQNGQNEEMIGRVLKGIRKDIVLSSKLRPYNSDNRKAKEQSLDESLRALRTDYIDILYIHGATSTDEIGSDAIRDFFNSAKKSGKIRTWGFTTHENQLDLVRKAVSDRFHDVLMIPYNHAGMFRHSRYGFHSKWNQAAMEEELKKAATAGIGMVAMKTCSAGPLKEAGAGVKTFRAALEWVLKNRNIHSATVAMGNFEEAEEDLSVLKGRR